MSVRIMVFLAIATCPIRPQLWADGDRRNCPTAHGLAATGAVNRAARNRSSADDSSTHRRRCGYVGGKLSMNERTAAATSGDWYPLSAASAHRFGKKISPVR